MDLHNILERRREFYFVPSQTLRGGITAGFVVGVIALIAAMLSVEPARIWASLLLNVFLFFSLALGGVIFAGIQDIVGALWSRPIKRLHEGFAAFLPFGAAFLVFFLLCISFDILGARGVYVWMRDPHMLDHFAGKRDWLVPQFMVIRDIVALVITVVLAMWQLKLVAQRDAAFVAGNDTKGAALAVAARDKLRYWCAPILVVYALTYSLLAFDLLMSLAPLWFSTLWACWVFAIMMQTLMASILVVMFAVKNTAVGHVFKRQQFHDVGKLMHGFTVFFAYLTYAHVLTYWYGNVPEETEYFLERMQGPWLWVIIIVPFFNFVIPLYTLIFKAAKWTAPVTLTLCTMILVAQWFVYVFMVVPAVDGHHWNVPWLDVGMLALVLCSFLAVYLAFAARVPMLGLGDKLLAESLADHH